MKQGEDAAGGRPRDPRIHEAALDATGELLVSGSEVTLAAVAERAGTTKPALYRRWPSLVHLIYEVAFPAELMQDSPLSTELDLGALVRGTRDVFTTPVVEAALPKLLAEFSVHPELHADLISRFATVFSDLDALVKSGIDAGEVATDVRAEELIAAVLGSVLTGLLLAPADLDEAWADRLTRLLERGIRP